MKQLFRTKSQMDESQLAQLEAWKKEQGNRIVGTGGLKGAVTVTGHGLKGAGSRSGSVGGRTMQRVSADKPRKVAKSASVLAKVSSKQSRFGS